MSRELKLVQELNAYAPIDVTFPGILIEEILEHPWKQEGPMVEEFERKVTDSKLEHPKKA